jgi:hypothetical protein
MQPGDQISIPDKIIAATNILRVKPPGEVRDQLISLVNELIHTDFHALVQLLYRVDVDEKKLKHLLKTNPHKDSAPIIADLIISRQLQKIASGSRAGGKNETFPEDSW